MGLLIKEAQYRRDNSQTSNRYTLQSPQSAEKPATDVNPAPVQNEPPGVSEMNPQELEYTNLIMDSALTDRPARERVGSSAQPQYEEKATAAEEEKEEPLEAVLERCELPLFTAEWRIMFYQAVVSLYFSGNIKVGKARIPSRWIRRCMKHLNYHALEAARDKLERCDFSEIRNTGAYVQAVVFNSIMELESDLLGWVSKVPASWIPLSS
jgi:hypothetical protein